MGEIIRVGKLHFPSKGLVPENSRLAAEEGKLSKKTPRVRVLVADGFVVVRISVSGYNGSPGELLFRAQDLSFGEIICLYYVHHVTAKFKTLFPYGGFSLTYAWFTNGSISQFGLLGRGSPKRVRH